MVAHLIFEAVRSIPGDDRTKEVHFLCTDTRAEIPAVVETSEGTLAKMPAASDEQGLRNHALTPPASPLPRESRKELLKELLEPQAQTSFVS